MIMKKTTVVHCKKHPYDVYIGRANGEKGKWGNPFTHLNNSTQAEFIVPTREDAIEAYRKWITEGAGQHLLKDLHELKGKTLGCWCVKEPVSEIRENKVCHGEVLMELVEKYLES